MLNLSTGQLQRKAEGESRIAITERILAVAGRPNWLPKREYPFETKCLEVDGRHIHYIDEGSGPTMLFVHAGPAWSFVFRDVIIRLRERFRCVALDFPGSGLSPAVANYRPGIEAASQILEAFVLALDQRDVTLVVHDLGGPVAFGVAARLPDRFRAMAIAESFGWPLSEEHPKTARMLRIVGGPTFGRVNDVTNLLTWATSTPYGVGRRLTAAGRKAFRGPYRDRRVRRIALAMLGDALPANDYLRSTDLALRGPLRDRPVLLFFGGKSPQMKEGFREGWVDRFPEARLLVVEGGHHFPMMDEPEVVADAIQSWWDEVVKAPRADSVRHQGERLEPTALLSR